MLLKDGVKEKTVLKMYTDELFFLRAVMKYIVIFDQSDCTTDLTFHKL